MTDAAKPGQVANTYYADNDSMDCIHCGLSEDVETNTWGPVWADQGRVYLGMECGQCES